MANGVYFKDLQSYVSELQKRGEMKTVKGANWDLEIGILTEMTVEVKNHPALLFEAIKDYPKESRLLTNAMTTIRRTAIALGLPEDVHPLEMLKIWKDKRAGFQPVAPVTVENALVKQNIIRESDVDIYKLPVPFWHEHDGGRYVGTGDAVIMRELDGDWVNVGTYRMMIHDKNTIALHMSPGRHGQLILQKAKERHQSLPVAVSLGHDPVLAVTAAMPIPPRVSEYELAGWLLGKPYEVTPGVVTGLPVPANAEIVIEGEILPSEIETRMEGPFGEWTGYYGGGPRPQPVVKVKSILYRDNPILWGMPAVKPFRVQLAALPFTAAETWDALEKAGVPEVRGVWQAGGIWYPSFTIIAIKQRYGGHSKQAGLVASGAKGTAYLGRFVIVVDDDIDITNLEDVVWAISTRCDPASGIDLLRNCLSSPLDPLLPPQVRLEAPYGTQVNSRVIIDACKPFQWYDKFPMTNIASPELRKKVQQRFESFFQEITKERR